MTTKKHQSPPQGYEETIARLEAALAAEEKQSVALRQQLEGLETKITDVERRVEARVEEAVARAEKAESQLKDQSARLEVLGKGREESMLALNGIRSELDLVMRERDQLRQQLTAVEGMQTETAAFADDELDEGGETSASSGAEEQLPSIEELMGKLSAAQDGGEGNGFAEAAAEDGEPPEAEWKEMIAPEAIVANASATGNSSNAPFQQSATRMLIGLESEGEHAITEPLTTIGRSESADVSIDGNFISRIHARILMIGAETVIEDAGSKNGIRVNSEKVERHVLHDGDLIRIGTVRFRYIDRSEQA